MTYLFECIRLKRSFFDSGKGRSVFYDALIYARMSQNLQMYLSFLIMAIVYTQFKFTIIKSQQLLDMYSQYNNSSSLNTGARQNFVKKVYTVLSVQIAFTVLMVYLNFSFRSFAKFQARNNWLFWVSFIITLGSLISLFFGKISRTFPINFSVLGLFTLGESYMVSCICSMYTADSVLLAAVATLSATLGLTYHAMTTKNDYTSWTSSAKGLLYSISWAVLSVSLINIFFIRSSLIVTGIAILMSVVYSIYILVDTHLIMGGKNKELSLDDYVLGSIILYVDIISLFLKILQILGKKKDD